MKKRSTAPPSCSLPSVLALTALWAVALALAGCQPTLPDLRPGSGAAGTEAEGEPRALLEPAAPFEEAPRVARVRFVPAPGTAADASRVLFVKGHVGPGHVRQVESGDVSEALRERVLPALAWLDEDGSIVVAPSILLEPGVTYGVVSGAPPLGVNLRGAAKDDTVLLDRAWPPPEAPGAGPFAIYCGINPLAAPPPRVDLEPGGLAASLDLLASRGMSPSCLRLDLLDLPHESADEAADSAPGIAPPALLTLADGSTARLDPTPIAAAPSEAPPPIEPLACAAGEVVFGPGCAKVTDDRLFIATPDVPLLWSVRSPALGDVTRVTGPSEPWVLLGLPPAAPADLSMVTVDVTGREALSLLHIVTAPPMPHVVLTEVLANPLGPEPDQEWVELYNDGLAGADLTGYALSDIGGKTPLPSAALAPGAYALLVNEAFVEDDDIDPRPAKGTLLLRVPKLGKDGLKNDGEPLKLLGAAGDVLSRFPAAPKPKAGQSVARVAPSAPDGDVASFVAAAPTPGAPVSREH